jgi:outer membrane protein with beta-barrel domain
MTNNFKLLLFAKNFSMRYLLLTLGVFISAALHAQFGVYVQGGGNYSMLRSARSPGVENGKNGFGWQAGFGGEYHTQFGYFLYLGVDVSSQTLKKDSTSIGFHNVVTDYTSKPLFVNFPVGIGYQFDVTKDVGLKVYGGITTQVGVGGNLKRNTDYYTAGPSGSPVHVRTNNESHRIHYGRGIQVTDEFQSDLNNTIWGLNIGAGLNFSKSVEVAVFYQEGLTNILPGGDAATEVNKLRSVSIDLRFYFPKQYYSSKQKR